jgi:hypothetical protein
LSFVIVISSIVVVAIVEIGSIVVVTIVEVVVAMIVSRQVIVITIIMVGMSSTIVRPITISITAIYPPIVTST